MPPNDTDARLKKILAGAFAGPPTPLKAIPKKNGEPRSAAKKKVVSSAASAKNARPKP
jgi:hypothetical protein